MTRKIARKPIAQSFISKTDMVRILTGELPVPEGYKIKHNLMSNKPILVADETPICCDPSSETYWSM